MTKTVSFEETSGDDTLPSTWTTPALGMFDQNQQQREGLGWGGVGAGGVWGKGGGGVAREWAGGGGWGECRGVEVG